jgi:hypothetical protein
MKLTLGLATAAVAALLTGCADTAPIEADLKDLHAQVSRLQAEVGSVKRSADTAATQAAAARNAAEAARATAQKALDLAAEDQRKIDATNEKLERIFKHHLTK